MSIVVILLIALVAIIIAGAVFALIRQRQRSGSVLAAPDAFSDKSGGKEQ